MRTGSATPAEWPKLARDLVEARFRWSAYCDARAALVTERFLATVAEAVREQRLEITVSGLRGRQLEHFQGQDPLSTLIREESYRAWQTQLLDDLLDDQSRFQYEAYEEFSKVSLSVLRSRHSLYDAVMDGLEITPVLVKRGVGGGAFRVVAVDDADGEDINLDAEDVMTLGGTRFSRKEMTGVVPVTDLEEWWLGYSYDLITSRKVTIYSDNLLGLLKRVAIARLIDTRRMITVRRRSLRTTALDDTLIAPGEVEEAAETTTRLNQTLTLIVRHLEDRKSPATLNVRIGLIIFLYFHAGAPAAADESSAEKENPTSEKEQVTADHESMSPEREVAYKKPRRLRTGDRLNRAGITRQPEVSNSAASIWRQLQNQAERHDEMSNVLYRMIVDCLGADSIAAIKLLYALSPALETLQTPGRVNLSRAKRALTDFNAWWQGVLDVQDLVSESSDAPSRK